VGGAQTAELELRVDVRQRAYEVDAIGQLMVEPCTELERAAVDAEVEALLLPLAEQENLAAELARSRQLDAVAGHVREAAVDLQVDVVHVDARVAHLGERRRRSHHRDRSAIPVATLIKAPTSENASAS